MDAITKEEYIAMLQAGQDYHGEIEGGGFADTISISVISDHLEYPYDKISLQGGHCFHNITVPVCFLSKQSIKMQEIEPPTIDMNSINAHLRSLRDHINATQKYEKIDAIVDYYRKLEDEIDDFRKQRTVRGEGFTSRAKKRVNDLLEETMRIIQSNSNEMKALQAQRAAEQDPGLITQIERNIDNKIKDHEELHKELLEMVRELKLLAKSTQVYDIKNKDAGQDPQVPTGSHEYDIKKNRVVLNVERKTSDEMGLLAHELKHAFQFEMSKLSIVPRNQKGSFFIYDKHDEVEAYKRGTLFKGPPYITINQLPPEYGRLPIGPLDLYNHDSTIHTLQHPNLQLIRRVLQDIANRVNVIFRINDVTYIPER